MTWLAVCDHADRRLSLRGLGIDKQERPVVQDNAQARLTKGTILFETRVSADNGPQVLFGYKTLTPAQRSLTFQAIPGGGIAMVQVQGDAICHGAIHPSDTERTDVVRVTYSWDTDRNWARLTLERPADIHGSSVQIHNPQSLSLNDLRDLVLARSDATFCSDMIFAAVSDTIEPIGPMPTLLPSTPLATPWGYQNVSALKRGDTVVTGDSDVVPVLQTLRRVVPARGSFRPIRLRAPYFGLQQDVIVAPDQRLLMDGPEVEYLFGHEAVLVSARHLINGFAAFKEPCGPTIAYSQLLLPRHETVRAAGTATESLYIGRARRDKELMQSSLFGGMDRGLLPEHPKPAHPVLRWYDAIHLVRRRAA